MNEADIDLIQSALELELPDSYRKFILNYPDALHTRDCHAWQVELLDIASRVVTLNCDLRSSQSIDWEEDYLIIGESGCGDYYAIDIDDEDSPVYFWNHDIGDFDEREETPSLNDFSERMVQMYEYVRQSPKAWWKFWQR